MKLRELRILLEMDYSSADAVIQQIKNGNQINGVKKAIVDDPKFKPFVEYTLKQAKENKVSPNDILSIAIKKEYPNVDYNFDPYIYYAKYKDSSKFKDIRNQFLNSNMSPTDFEHECTKIVNSNLKLNIRNSDKNIQTIYQKGNWSVVTPKTFEASVKAATFPFGKTHWCTAASKHYFDRYTRSGKYPLFIISGGTKDTTFQACFGEIPDFKDFNDGEPDIENLKKVPTEVLKKVSDGRVSLYGYYEKLKKMNKKFEGKTSDGWTKKVSFSMYNLFDSYVKDPEHSFYTNVEYTKGNARTELTRNPSHGVPEVEDFTTSKVTNLLGYRNKNSRYFATSNLYYDPDPEDRKMLAAAFPRVKYFKDPEAEFRIYPYKIGFSGKSYGFSIINDKGNELTSMKEKPLTALPEKLRDKVIKKFSTTQNIRNKFPEHPKEVEKHIFRKNYEHSKSEIDLANSELRRAKREAIAKSVTYTVGTDKKIDDMLKEQLYGKITANFNEIKRFLFKLERTAGYLKISVNANEMQMSADISDPAFVRYVALKYFKEQYKSYLGYGKNTAKNLYNNENIKESYFNY